MFRRDITAAVGGYALDTVGEDMELVVRMHRYCSEHSIPYRMRFVPDSLAWTECPESLSVLGRQRGLVQSLWRHRVMLLNPRYGRVGLLAYPHYFFLEMLGPMVELLAYLSFAITLLAGHATWPYSVAFLGVSVFLGGALTLSAVVESEMSTRRYQRPSDLARLVGLALVENLGYRQPTLWWRLKGTISAARGVEAWGESVRKGFGADKEPSAG